MEVNLLQRECEKHKKIYQYGFYAGVLYIVIDGRDIALKYILLFIAVIFLFQQKALSENMLDEFLIAEESMLDPRFKNTVIILFHHNQTGAAGLVVNKPIKKISIAELFEISNLTPPKDIIDKEITIYWGGPVEPRQFFFIHSSDYKSEDLISSKNNFMVTQKPEVLIDIAKNKGPKKYLVLLGISVWEVGQLDREIAQGGWRKKSSSYSLLFNNDSEMWQRLLNSQEI